MSTVLPSLPYLLEDAFAHEHSGVPLLDADMVATIGEIGFHPFLLVRFESSSNSESQYLVCKTQNETAEFVEELGGRSELSELWPDPWA